MTQLPVPNPPNPVPPPAGSPPEWFNTPFRIITFAMRNAGLIGRTDEPTSEDYAEYMVRLNDIFNHLQTKGLKLWLQQDLAITPVAGQNLYSFGPTGNVVMPRPPRIIEAYYSDANNVRRPLVVLSRNEWDYLSTLLTEGDISSYFVDKQQFLTNFWMWLTPDAEAATGTVHTLAQIQVNNVISLTDNLNFPQEWFRAMHWTLGYEISVGQPMSVVQLCMKNSEKYLEELEDWDVEDAGTQLQPDPRSQYVAQKFS